MHYAHMHYAHKHALTAAGRRGLKVAGTALTQRVLAAQSNLP